MSAYLRLLILVLAMPFLTAASCATRPPKEILVEVPVVVGVPEELAQDCPIEEPANTTVKELLRVAKERKTSLENCNLDKKAIRELRR